MPPKNLNVILLAFIVSLMCYLTSRRAKTAMMVGDALDLINTHYVDPVDEDQLLIAAMNGMTSTLDANCEYIPIDRYASFQDSINQEFTGIGIYVEQPDPNQPVRVITPLVGSPALLAGMLPADEIVRIDGEDVSKLELKDVSSKLKGPIGSNVNVVVRREEEQVTLSIKRTTIELESVIGDHRNEKSEWVFRLKDRPEIAYVRLTSFGEKTTNEGRKVFLELNNDFRGLILDLRGNSGGLLYSAVDVCDMFLEEGRIVSTRVRGGRVYDEFDAEQGVLVSTDKPVVVLIDENSASASEIVAACLQDQKRAKVVGARSYGKGTVQNVLPLQYGRSALRLTVARYYRPNGKDIHRSENAKPEDEWGVTPDEGMAIKLDDETRIDLAKRWQIASYPSLANPSNTVELEKTPSGLEVDPAVKRAVQAIDEGPEQPSLYDSDAVAA